MGARGALYVAFGRPAVDQARLSIQSLHLACPGLPVTVVGGEEAQLLERLPWVRHSLQERRDDGGRWEKVRLYDRSSHDHTLYLDADTRVHQTVEAGFRALEHGWDVAISHSECQGDRLLWHVGRADREETLSRWPCAPLQLQGGVFFFRRSAAVEAFFALWRIEWETWEDQDQGAMLRALAAAPVRVWLLGRPWNGGAVINHLFGRAKQRGG